MPLDRSDVGFKGFTPAATSSPSNQSDSPDANNGALEQFPPRAERISMLGDDIGAVRHFSVRTPPFWKHRPEEWFAQLESIFACQQVNPDAQRFHTVVAGLDSETVHDIMDVIQHPPAENRYAYLKRLMLERWGNTPKQQLHELLSGLTMGDRKPTQLLRHMRHLAGNSVSDEALKVRWLDLLPATVSRMLAVLRTSTLDELALAADEIIASAPDVCAIHPARQARTPSFQLARTTSSGAAEDVLSKRLCAVEADLTALRTSVQADLAALRTSLSQLMVATTRVLEHVSHDHDSRGHGARPLRRRSRSRTPTAIATGRPTEFCYFHQRFGRNAKNCHPPCAFRPTGTPEN